jgi:hypothetical protein
MNQEVAEAIEQLKVAFTGSAVTVTEDGQGGAYVVVEDVDLGPGFEPRTSWMGGHITALYPAADIYPLFIDAGVRRINGRSFEVPITAGHRWRDRPALQVSRINRQVQLIPQTAVMRFKKTLSFLETLS